jgi:hypothetical protein
MKKLVYILLFPLMIGASTVSQAQNYAEASLGLPGDNLNLFAVMKLFQESETLEGFERELNNENNMINNLDLNRDNRIDYIRVIDNPDGNIHVIVLQVAINARENQDVAVFYVQRENNNQVRIQLIGDEALYGRDYIVEPNYDSYGYNETPNPGYTGNTRYVEGQTVVVNRVTPYEVAAWPLMRFIFLPGYVAWHSPWYWDYYPYWWHPWRPCYWHYYYGYHYNWYPHYYGYYNHSHHHYDHYYDTYYHSSRRNYSAYVSTGIKSGHYKTTYSRPESRRAGSEMYSRTNQNRETTSRSARMSSSSTARSIKTTTGRTVERPAESRSARPSEVMTSRSSNHPATTKSTVKTETRKPSASREVSKPSQSRKTTGSTQVKSRSSKPSQEKKSSDRTEGTSPGRR